MKVERIIVDQVPVNEKFQNCRYAIESESERVIVFTKELREELFEKLLNRLKCSAEEFFDPDTELTFETESYELYLEEIADYLKAEYDEESGKVSFSEYEYLEEAPGMLILELVIALKNKIFYEGTEDVGVYYT